MLATRRFGAALLLGLVLAAGLRADPSPDRITLKDGRVVTGTIVQETRDEVVLRMPGALRHFQRNFIRHIDYGGDLSEGGASAPSAPDASAAEAPAPPPGDRLDLDLSRRYDVPVAEVEWVRRQGIGDADVPLVFFIAAQGAVLPGRVVDLRLKGWAWQDIERHFGMEPKRVYFVPGPVVPYPLLRASILWPLWLLQLLTHARR